MRLFVGLDIEPAIHAGISRFLASLKAQAPEVKWVRPESLHVTLKFIGEVREDRAAQIKKALASVSAGAPTITFSGTGFFPNARAPRVFWVGVNADDKLAELARKVDETVAAVGFDREKNAYKPHLTLARSGSGSPQPRPGDRAEPKFQRVQRIVEQMPPAEFGTMTPRNFYLYESKLGAGGAKYTKIEGYPLG